MTWTASALLFSPALPDLVGHSSFGLIDCGARGSIPQPWADFETAYPGCLTVLGFEADAAEAARLNKSTSGQRIYIPAAAWNEKTERPFYMTDPPQTSSLFPPNPALDHLFARSGAGMVSLFHSRRLLRDVLVPAVRIDDTLQHHPMDVDVIKLDTQGSEYEILEGAPDVLARQAFAVVAETWTVEAYLGIKRTWDVMKLMTDQGFEVMAQDVAGQARRHFTDAKTLDFLQREQVISLEVLFFKSAEAVVAHAATPAKVYKAVAISDVYGFPDYGVDLLTHILRRWPDQLAQVQRCYDLLCARRAVGQGATAAVYPALNGEAFVQIKTGA